MTFHHLGIACFNIDETALFYIQQGYIKSETLYDPIQKVNICFLKNESEGSICIELISPHDESSPINKHLFKNGVSPYHICYETDNLEQTIEKLKTENFLLISRPAPAAAIANKEVCFLFKKSVGLIELVRK